MDSSEMEARGRKTLRSKVLGQELAGQKRPVAAEPMRRPSWLAWTLTKSFRLLALTALWSGLGMGVGLFAGILAMAAVGAIHQRMPEMDLAYRQFAIPAAIVAGSCALLWNLVRTVQAAMQRLRER